MEIPQAITGRDPSNKPTDASALRALAQAAINVELFTIPLYMGTLYSIHGMHEINAPEQTFYQGRQWPGAATVSSPRTANEKAFNILFSIFIEEMLHLQLAANLATVMGVTPSFTSAALQDEHSGWTCYGPDKTQLPHILDLRDTTKYDDIKVQIGELEYDQLQLFLAIEEPEQRAKDRIKDAAKHKYFPAVPFTGWTPEKTEVDLPLFGSIGHMYRCMAEYMSIRYTDGKTLWDEVYTNTSVQRDIFNSRTKGHAAPEYPGFAAGITVDDSGKALVAAFNMINAITDQGEGGEVADKIQPILQRIMAWPLTVVKKEYQSSHGAMEEDYPSYSARGKRVDSRDAAARASNDKRDHYERFEQIRDTLLREVITWSKWHEGRGRAPWRSEDLRTQSSGEASSRIPSAADVAAALNRLQANDDDGSVLKLLSQVATGAIAGVTKVMNDYWQGRTQQFPFPSMTGSGDRMAMCWAVLGRAPDLSVGIQAGPAGALQHACQGLDFENPAHGGMPHISTYHTCRGSNACRGQGGCGFVQPDTGGGMCGSSHKAQMQPPEGTTYYSAPGDNRCQTFGGCAVPISASQLFPGDGTMQLYDLQAEGKPQQLPNTLNFSKGEPVYDIAWSAYCEVLKHQQRPIPEKPEPDDLRVALTPST